MQTTGAHPSAAIRRLISLRGLGEAFPARTGSRAFPHRQALIAVLIEQVEPHYGQRR